MASIRIHQDQENRVEVRQKGNASLAIVSKKRSVLRVIDNNQLEGRLPHGKQSLAPLKENVKKSEIPERENKKNLVNPIVPVAQFEAFKVYEDRPQNGDILNAQTEKFELRLEHKSTNDEAYKEIEPSPQNMSIQSITSNSNSPMVVESSLDESGILAEQKILEKRTFKNLLYEIEEYRPDIYKYLREHELRHRPKPFYMRKQPDINHNMRTILVDWLVEVAEEYKLQTETLYLAVNFIDRFLSYMSVVRAKLQLVGTAAMFIAAKYEEIYPPDVSEFVYITDDTYSKRQVIRMEQLILKVLGFDLSIPTPLQFITIISVLNKVKDKVVNLAMYLSELGLLEAEPYLEFLPSVLAASAVAIAQHTVDEQVWGKEFVATTGFELMHLEKCIAFLHSMYVKVPTLPQHAIQEKYKSLKYLHVSKIVARNDCIKFV